MVTEVKEPNPKNGDDNTNSIDATPILDTSEETNNLVNPTNQSSKAMPSTKSSRSPPSKTRKSPRHKLLQAGDDLKKVPGSKGIAQSLDDKAVHTQDSDKILEKSLRAVAPFQSPPNFRGTSFGKARSIMVGASPPNTSPKGLPGCKKGRKKQCSKIKSLPFLEKDPKISKILMEQESRAFSRKVSNTGGTKLVSSSPNGTPQEVNVFVWKAEEVINFFRGLYNYGWGSWSEISRMTETRSNMQAKTHAQKLEQRFPMLRTYFSPTKVKLMHRKFGMVRRYVAESEDGSSEYSSGKSRVSMKSTRSSSNKSDLGSGTAVSTAATTTATKPRPNPSPKMSLRVQSKYSSNEETPSFNNIVNVYENTSEQDEVNTKPDDSALMAASVIKSLKSNSEPVGSPPNRFFGKSSSKNAPKVTFFLGNYKIDTGYSNEDDRKRSVDTLGPPRAPVVNNRNIFIPGLRVYARWLDEDDPDSYGAWYPGYLAAATAVTEEEGNDTPDIPNLRYHIKFDDGVDVTNQKGKDIMMHEEYRSWIQNLEDYHALSVTRNMVSKRLTKGTKVFAKFIDESDPETHGQWLAGTILGSKVSNRISQLRYSYHVLFYNGDQDEDLSDIHVLEEDSYHRLVEEKNENRNKRQRASSGLDFLCGAAHITSPIKSNAAETDFVRLKGRDATQSALEPMEVRTHLADKPNKTSAPTPPSNTVSSNVILQSTDGGSFIKPELDTDLICHEVLESRNHSPGDDDRGTSSLHYGCYFVTKTVKVPQYISQKKTTTHNPSVSHRISPTLEKTASLDNRPSTKNHVTPSSYASSSSTTPTVIVKNALNSIEAEKETSTKAAAEDTPNRDPKKISEKFLSADSEVIHPTQIESREKSVSKETNDKYSNSQLHRTSNESSTEVNVTIADNKKHQDQHMMLASGSPKSTAEEPEDE